MTVRLRAHHLLCMLTYQGKGYSPAFIAGVDAIATRIGEGEEISLVQGPDDICSPLLPDSDPHCLRESAQSRDELSRSDLSALLGVCLETGSSIRIDPAMLETMRAAFSSGLTRRACQGCEWRELCDSIAQDDFRPVVLATVKAAQT